MAIARTLAGLAAACAFGPGLGVGEASAQTVEYHKRCAELGGAARAPRFSIVDRNRTPGNAPVLKLRITVPLEAVDTVGMVPLACRLREDFPREIRIDAYIFDNEAAAKHLELGWEDQKRYIPYLWHLKARYHLDREQRTEFVEFLFPDVQDGLPIFRRVKIWLDKPS